LLLGDANGSFSGQLYTITQVMAPRKNAIRSRAPAEQLFSNRPSQNLDLIYYELDACNFAHGFLRQLCVIEAAKAAFEHERSVFVMAKHRAQRWVACGQAGFCK
jgi:hypothetical protein